MTNTTTTSTLNEAIFNLEKEAMLNALQVINNELKQTEPNRANISIALAVVNEMKR
jgi:hypothetical protein